MNKSNEILAALAIKYNGDWEAIYKSISEKKDVDSKELDAIISRNSQDYITILDEDYPLFLKTQFRPPFVLFYKGNINLLKEEKLISIVGSREASEYGLNKTKEISKDLVKKGYVIVSGLAKGVDAAALQEGVKKGRAIAFLGNGVNVYYPRENFSLQNEIASKGLLMSEYPSKCQPAPEHFPVRNRLIAHTGKGLLVTEAYQRSGTLITVACALEANKTVFCIPYQAGSGSACNTLIREGACLIETANDIDYFLDGSH